MDTSDKEIVFDKDGVCNHCRQAEQSLIELKKQRDAFSPDDASQRELEDAFPYEETADQLRAIREIKADMEQPKPMDRLLCGDVGFGKTEVAIRAAYKASPRA